MDKQGGRNLREIIVYIIFGVLSTLVMAVTYQGLEWYLKPRWGDHSYQFSNVVAFIVALVFAYIVNKLFVFQQKSWERRVVVKEASAFALMRLASFGMDHGLTTIFNELVWRRADPWFTPRWAGLQERLGLDILNKIAPMNGYRFLVKWGFIAVLVVILNYIFSKFLIFRKKKEEAPQEPQEETEDAG